MLHHTLKQLRKSRGITQEELASALHVVRQTVSKWERGTSVPDADALVAIADYFDVSVSTLLGNTDDFQKTQAKSDIAQELGHIAQQMAIRNRRAKRICQFLGVLFGLYILFWVALLMVNFLPGGDGTLTLTQESVTTVPSSIEVMPPSTTAP